jgi:hypothetical protein
MSRAGGVRTTAIPLALLAGCVRNSLAERPVAYRFRDDETPPVYEHEPSPLTTTVREELKHRDTTCRSTLPYAGRSVPFTWVSVNEGIIGSGGTNFLTHR